MKQYLYIALILFLVAIIAALFFSCAPVWQSSCSHNSVLAIAVVGTKYPTRLAIGFASEASKKRGVAHVQAEYFRGGEWRPLQVYHWPEVMEGEREFELIDVYYISGKAALKKHIDRIKD